MEIGVHSGKKRKEIRTSRWSNLPQDLSNLIIRNLYFTDRISFRMVCKNWRILICDRPINELPWVMNYNCFYSQHITELYDPVSQKKHTIPIPTIDVPNFDWSWSCFAYARICASKCGWLLLSKQHKTNTKNTQFLLYSPFSNNVIMLPGLNISYNHYYDQAAFSGTNPKSPDCIFFVVTHCYEQGKCKLRISTHRNGDDTWRTKFLDGEFNRLGSIVCAEKGVCYIVLQCGKLGAFCVESQECTWLVDSLWIRIPVNRNHMHLVEFNEDLLLAKYCSKYDSHEVFRYDGNERRWIEQESLGAIALFISFWGSYLRHAIGDTTDLADKIFCNFIHNYSCETKVYSLNDGNRYKKSRASAYDWMVKDSLHKIWIEPPY